MKENENGENLPYLEITEILLIHCNAANNTYQQDSSKHLCLTNLSVNY